MSYICNITGGRFDLEDNEKHRELGNRFNYNVRFRAICYVFCILFYGECKILKNLPENKNLKGIGMSDSAWSEIFKKKFNYVNTFYHKIPYLDIYNQEHLKKYQNLDFIISSDVFEHINPYPNIQYAFNNLFSMLKSGGYLIFSVPYSDGEHKEHFPNLFNYEIKNENGKYILYNKTRKNKLEIFENLCFHGGPGDVLEMRIFSKSSIIFYLKKAGFDDIKFYEINKDMNRFGIFWSVNNNNNCSLIISAKKSD